jgi:large subunit ribosomal protein L9
MEVVLLEAVIKLGQLGDTVNVKAGYARNYLIPQRKAVRATPDAIAEVEQQRTQLVKEEKKRLDVARARAEYAVKSLTFVKRVIDDEGRLFGSVSVSEIIERAAESGTELLRSEIDMPSGSIKNTGEHTITVKVHPEVSFDVSITVVAGDQEVPVEELIEEDVQSEKSELADSSSNEDTGDSASEAAEQPSSMTEEKSE